jgi:hypothetical protein
MVAERRCESEGNGLNRRASTGRLPSVDRSANVQRLNEKGRWRGKGKVRLGNFEAECVL